MIVLRDTVLVDIDHTLSAAWWRDQMIGTVSWDEYHAASSKDEPIPEMVRMIRALHDKFRIVGLSSRPGKWRKQTMDWCIKHNVPLDDLILRPDDAFEPANELKPRLAREWFGHEMVKHAIAFIIDDRADVIAAFAAMGITGLQVTARRPRP